MKSGVGMQVIVTSFAGRPLNLVLWRGRQVALVDTGLADTVGSAILPALQSMGVTPADLSLVIITHAHTDHFAGNEEILRVSEGRAQFAAHRLDTPWIEHPPSCTRQAYGHYVDLGLMTATELDNAVAVSGQGVRVQHVLEGGEVYDLGDGLELEIHFTPGHSAGHICVLDRRNRVLVQGEAAAGVAQYDVQGRLLTAPYYEDLAVYLSSLAQLARLDFDTLVPSHLPPMDRAHAARFLADSLDFALRMESEVVDHLRKSAAPLTALQLWRSLNGLWGVYPRDLGLYMLLEAHLNGLIRRGKASGSLASGVAWLGRELDDLATRVADARHAIAAM